MKIIGNTIQITNEKDLVELDSKVAQVQMQYVGFVVFTLTTIINEYIIDPIHDSMRDAGVSQKIIDTTYLDVKAEQHNKIITFHIKSDYISESGFPVAQIIEYGRKAYTIKPTEKKFLSWIKDGLRRFAKEVHIPKKEAGNHILDGILIGQPKVQQELNRRTKIWLSKILKS